MQELEDLVAGGLYPPAIHCAVTYSQPPDFEYVSLETLEVVMTGTDQQQVTFPVEVYQAKGECMYVFHFASGRLNFCLRCALPQWCLRNTEYRAPKPEAPNS